MFILLIIFLVFSNNKLLDKCLTTMAINPSHILNNIARREMFGIFTKPQFAYFSLMSHSFGLVSNPP